MKTLTIDSSILRRAMVQLQQAMATRNFIPALDNIRATMTPGSIKLLTTDSEITIITTLECQTKDSHEFLIPFADLKRITALERGVLEFAITKDSIIITCGEDSFNLGAPMHIDEFPKVDRLPDGGGITLDSNMMQSIKAALLTVEKDKDTFKPAFKNVLLHFHGNKFNVASSDASYLFWRWHPIENDIEEWVPIPPNIVHALDGMPGAVVCWNKTNVGFVTNDTTVIARRPVEKYPNYFVIVPAPEWNGTCFRYDLLNAVLKCQIAGNHIDQVVIEPGNGSWELSSDQGEASKIVKVKIDGTYEGKVPRIAFNGTRLVTILKQMKEDVQELRIMITEHNKPILISPKDDDQTKSVLASLVL